jgi:hypothetical protein
MPLEEQAERARGRLDAERVEEIRREAIDRRLAGGLHAVEHGGQGWSHVEWFLVEEQFGRSTNALSWHVPSADNVLAHGSPQQIQTGYDPSPAPAGHHLLSVVGQYAPYELAEGTWDSRREEVARQFIDLIARFSPDFEDRLAAHEVLGPPDIEARIGLTGGNIFQGEVTPDQMWEHRLTPRTPVPGLYFCGAATHPGGSVIALNGRNAARAVLADARELAAT